MNRRQLWRAACAFVGLSVTGSCTQPTDDTVTFRTHVEPLLREKCQSCHSPGYFAPFNLTTLQEARTVARSMAAATKAGAMPPWRAIDTDDCKPPLPWRDDPRLTADEISIFQRWVDGGMAEGPATSPAHTKGPATPKLEGASLFLTPQSPFVAAGVDDEYRCFVLDTNLPSERYLSGIDVIPRNRSVVHHAAVLVDADGTSAQQVGPDGSYACSPTQGFPASWYSLNAWTPGQLPTVFPDDAGILVPKGARLVLHVHYSPASGTGAGATDHPRVALRFHDAPPRYRVFFGAVGDHGSTLPNGDGLQPGPNDGPSGPEFRIPAGATGHTETMVGSIASDSVMLGPVLGVLAHAHLVGTNVKVVLEKADGRKQCLLNDRWDFHWQRIYSYDAKATDLPRVEPGDKIRVQCTYDNTRQNARLDTELVRRRRAVSEVRLGIETLDEMCHAVFQVLQPAPP